MRPRRGRNGPESRRAGSCLSCPGRRSKPVFTGSTGSAKTKSLADADVALQPAPRPRRRSAADVRRLRGHAARIFAQCGDNRARRADARLRPLQPSLRPDPGAGPPHVEKVKERQEGELINNANTACSPMRIPRRRSRRAAARRRRTTSTSSSRRSGKSRPSSSPIRAPSRPSAANAPAGACRRRR